MLLQSHDSFDERAQYDPTTCEFALLNPAERASAADVTGVFGYLGNARAILFRLDDVLYLEVLGTRVALAPNVIELSTVGSRSRLSVLSERHTTIEIDYVPASTDVASDIDPTPFVEAEDFDFGLFIYNVSRDAIRTQRLFRPSGTNDT